jgi:3-hydroxyisobutyrate dehydrogenase-like beta-hydroxyacid dehydrogenase
VTPAVLGFVGLGQMGSPMASRLAAAGCDLVAFDAAGTRERLPPGAQAAGSVGDVAQRADTILLSLPDGDASAAVADAVAATPQRRVRTVIDLSTIGPLVATRLGEQLAAAGVSYADGPVSGGVAGARAGTVSLMFAGPVAVLDDHRPVLDHFARVFHVGTTAGQGQTMKLVNNFLSAVALAATSEALALGEAHGLDVTAMLDVLNASTGRNSATVDKFPNRIVPGTFDAGFRTGLMAKDLRLYQAAVVEAGTAEAIGAVVCDLWQRADAALPGSDFTRIWEFVTNRSRTGG